MFGGRRGSVPKSYALSPNGFVLRRDHRARLHGAVWGRGMRVTLTWGANLGVPAVCLFWECGVHGEGAVSTVRAKGALLAKLG